VNETRPATLDVGHQCANGLSLLLGRGALRHKRHLLPVVGAALAVASSELQDLRRVLNPNLVSIGAYRLSWVAEVTEDLRTGCSTATRRVVGPRPGGVRRGVIIVNRSIA
jgi:hypothetical protein